MVGCEMKPCITRVLCIISEVLFVLICHSSDTTPAAGCCALHIVSAIIFFYIGRSMCKRSKVKDHNFVVVHCGSLLLILSGLS